MTDLLIAPCDIKAARFAVMNWHYSKTMPIGKLVSYGIWEDSSFIGSIIFGRGSSPWLGSTLKLDQTEVCELVRVAMSEHKCHVSQCLSVAVKKLKENSPNLRLIVSFADPSENHHGGIYQASGWFYTGESVSVTEFFYKGKWHHGRSAMGPTGWGGSPEIARLPKSERAKLPTRKKPGKYRYLYPLDKAMRRNVQSLAQPYPRGSSLKGETADFQSARPGSIPGNRSNS